MSRISIRAEREYDVIFTDAYLAQLLSLCANRKRVAIIYSIAMEDRIPRNLETGAEVYYFPIPDSESGKSTGALLKIWDFLGAAGFTRSDLIVGMGGGAVTDFAGFAAASWLRGIDWVAIPTTVAGMVDAAVGGKTGINSDYGKNLIGAFHSPSAVIVDLAWLSSLSDRDFAAGLAEVVKAGFIADPQILEALKGKTISDIRSSETLTRELIERAVQVKADVVGRDFKESFEREALNYGHTFGHAVEIHSKYSLRHGEAVSIGMAFIAHLSLEIGAIDSATHALHLEVLNALNLPAKYPTQDWPELLGLMRIDKKSRGSSLRFVILSEIGKTQRLENPEEEALIRAYEKVCQ